MVYEHVQIGGGARCYEEEHKRHPEARLVNTVSQEGLTQFEREMEKAGEIKRN